MKPGFFKKYAYAWITIAFFLISIVLHWLFGWYAFVDDAAQHGQQPQMSEYLVEMGRDTFENWQSEFLQLLWQVVGLAYFLYLGKEVAQKEIADIDERFLRHHGHAAPWGHTSEGRE